MHRYRLDPNSSLQHQLQTVKKCLNCLDVIYLCSSCEEAIVSIARDRFTVKNEMSFATFHLHLESNRNLPISTAKLLSFRHFI